MNKSTGSRDSKRVDAAFEQLLSDLHSYRESASAEEKTMDAEKAVNDACKAYAKKKAKRRAGTAAVTAGQR